MRIRTSNPSAIAAPASAFVHGVLVQEATTWLVISGQVGVDASGKLAGDTRAQTRRCFQNIFEVLHDNGMTVANLVKITVLLTSTDGTPIFREVRDEMLAGHLCASTLQVISALAHPDWSVEIEAIAAA
ncbi:MAG: 2-iminobutanoate/2-iminopropanoate deaminase [Gammaproteobacteria bacterium]|jgi:2-iminobutanoate/2-iminopropanoate deaminase